MSSEFENVVQNKRGQYCLNVFGMQLGLNDMILVEWGRSSYQQDTHYFFIFIKTA